MDLLPTMRSVRYMARHGRVVRQRLRRRLPVLRLAGARPSPASTPTRPGSSPTAANLPNARGPMGGLARRSPTNGEEGAHLRAPAPGVGLHDRLRRQVPQRLRGDARPPGRRPSRPGGRTSGRSSARPTTSGSSTPASRTSTASTGWSQVPGAAGLRAGAACGTGHTPATVIADHALDFLRSAPPRRRGRTSSRWRRTARTAASTTTRRTTATRCSRRRSATGPGRRRPRGNCGLVDCLDLTVADLPGVRRPALRQPAHAMPTAAGPRQWNAVPHEPRRVAEAETNLRDRARMAQSIDRMMMRILELVDDQHLRRADLRQRLPPRPARAQAGQGNRLRHRRQRAAPRRRPRRRARAAGAR